MLFCKFLTTVSLQNLIFLNFRKSDSMSNKRIEYPEMITFQNKPVQKVYLLIFLTDEFFWLARRNMIKWMIKVYLVKL